MRRRRLPILMLALTLALLATVSARADPPDPAIYLTANLTAVATSPAVTVMEQALLDRINAAAASIDAAIYDFERVSVRDALIAAHATGVTVRIVADDEARANPSYAPHFAALEAAGIPIVDDQDDSRIMHDKYLIFDRRQVWTGSTNLSDNDFTLNHNHSLAFDGAEIAALYQADFDQMVAGHFGAQKTASLTTTVTYHGFPVEVYFSPQDGAMAQVIAEVEAAQTSIDFAIFFFTEDALADALIAAHQRGVVIRGLWDALGAGNASSDDEALCAAGIPVKIEETAGKMHHKLMVIDAAGSDPTVIAGSLNWTAAADARNSENTVIVHDGATAQTLAAGFEGMWAGMAVAPCAPETGLAERLYLPVVVRGGEAAPDVRLVRIVYNPAGDDVAGERVEVRNFGGTVVELSGWTLEDAGSYRYAFPAFSLAAGGDGDCVGEGWGGYGDGVVFGAG
jgi:phosphatidylserine/phosphatidylglycerophosphate/cardiolipin synthase-like enzyme